MCGCFADAAAAADDSWDKYSTFFKTELHNLKGHEEADCQDS